MKYYNIHCHSFYSISDSTLDPSKASQWLKDRGIDKISITDHGNCVGAFNIRASMKENGIKHYPGCEFYFCNDRKDKSKENRQSFHLVAIAKTYEGVLNLFKMSSLSYTEGFYYRPRVDYDLLERFGKGIVFSSACLKGVVSKSILENKVEEAYSLAKRFKDILGESYFLEIMPHDLEEQRIINPHIISIGKKLDIKVVASNDAHYINKEDHDYRDILIMSNQKTTISSKDKMDTSCRTLYLMDAEEVKKCFKMYHPQIEEKDVDGAIENTGLVLDGEPPEMSDGKINFPTYTLDEKTIKDDNINEEKVKTFEGDKTQEKLAWELSYKGFLEKGFDKNEGYLERLEFEFEMIKKMGFINYFLIVRDIVKYCNRVGIKVGPGRGTAASSLFGHCLGITKIDPIKYGLIFHRFLNPERKGWPDIDLDFDYQRRADVIKYIYEKYGTENVSQIATVSKLALKSAIRDIARVLEYDTQSALEISMGVPWQNYKTVAETIENHPEAKKFVDENPELFKYVDKLVGIPRHFGKHPSGVVISSKKIIDFAPLMFGKDDDDGEKVVMVQFDLECIKKVGLIKMDILGLKTLSFIEDILRQIKKAEDKDIDIENINYEDPEVYKMISKGDTSYCFQIEADGITKAIQRIKPECFHELYDLLSLYRPGGLETGQLEKYIETKFLMKENPDYRMYPDIPEMEKILRDTYYTVCYQEQIMAIVGNVGGLGMATADVFRRIVDDLKLENKEQIIASYKEKFLEGCKKNKIDEERANDIWEFLQKYTGYSFNKSHSCAYSHLTYQTAWLKRYYQKYFLLSMFNTAEKNADAKKNSIKSCVRMARKQNVNLHYPDINKSGEDFVYRNDGIVWSLSHIKGIGEGPIKELLEKRPFKDINDLFEKVNRKKINKRVFVALYGAHAFDCFGKRDIEDKFKELYDEDINCLMPKSELMREIKFLGLPVKNSYAEEYGEQTHDAFRFSKLAKMKNGECNIFAGLILESALKKSKAGNIYASITVEDDVFNSAILYLKQKDYIRLGEHVEEGKFIKFQAEKIDSTKCRLRGYSLVSLKPISEKSSC